MFRNLEVKMKYNRYKKEKKFPFNNKINGRFDTRSLLFYLDFFVFVSVPVLI